MEADVFCSSLSSGDTSGAKRAISDFLKTLKVTTSNRQENFQKIKQWFEQYPCVETVEEVPGMLRVRPPIKEFIITLTTPAGGTKKQVGFRVEDNKISLLSISDVAAS